MTILPLDEHGRPYLPPDPVRALALENGYEGSDGKDLGAEVHPEDVGTFAENAARINQPAHVEPVSITPPVTPNNGYTGLNASNPTTPNLSVDEALAINQANALAAQFAAEQAAAVAAAELAASETIVPDAPAPPTEAPAPVTETSTEGTL